MPSVLQKLAPALRRLAPVLPLGALAVVLGGWLLDLPMAPTYLLGLALVLLGATLTNGRYVLRQLTVLVPTLLLVTALTFWFQNGRGDRRDLAFNILGPSATEEGVDAIVDEFRLGEPMHERYLLWLSDAVRGD